MALRANEFARREGGAVQHRSDALRLNWGFTDLPSDDSHALDVRFACSARIADNDADRRMFVEVFLNSRHSVTIDELIEHFARTVKSALTTLSSEHKASDIVGGADHKTAWTAAITKAA